jgi:hypothetical protein
MTYAACVQKVLAYSSLGTGDMPTATATEFLLDEARRTYLELATRNPSLLMAETNITWTAGDVSLDFADPEKAPIRILSLAWRPVGADDYTWQNVMPVKMVEQDARLLDEALKKGTYCYTNDGFSLFLGPTPSANIELRLRAIYPWTDPATSVDDFFCRTNATVTTRATSSVLQLYEPLINLRAAVMCREIAGVGFGQLMSHLNAYEVFLFGKGDTQVQAIQHIPTNPR